MDDEQDVSKLRLIKRERKELSNLVQEISQVSANAHKTLAAFGKRDATLNLKDQGLPAAEIETRKAISKTKGRALLLDKAKDFEVQLILSQDEALNYGAHLSRVVAAGENNAERARFLNQ